MSAYAACMSAAVSHTSYGGGSVEYSVVHDMVVGARARGCSRVAYDIAEGCRRGVGWMRGV